MIWEEDQEETVGMERINIYGTVTLMYVQVVRCKNCKYWYYGNYCAKHGKGQENADWFCADGERKGL